MNCPTCGYKLTNDDVMCPICETIITKNIKNDEPIIKTNDINKNNSVVDIKYRRTKTNKFIRLILACMFSAGISLFIILFLTGYHPINGTPIPTFRQLVALVIVLIHWKYIFQAPFVTEHYSVYKNKHLTNEERAKAVIYYLIRFFIFMSIWYLFLGKFVELNLTLAYNEGYRFTIIRDTIPHETFVMYSNLYYLGLILSYLPYTIYYLFDMYFEEKDVKLPILIFIFIDVAVFLLYSNL